MSVQRTTLQPGQYVKLARLPPVDPATGMSVPGLKVGAPGVVRRVGHDTDGQALVLVEFHGGAVWCACDSVEVLRVAQYVPEDLG